MPGTEQLEARIASAIAIVSDLDPAEVDALVRDMAAARTIALAAVPNLGNPASMGPACAAVFQELRALRARHDPSPELYREPHAPESP